MNDDQSLVAFMVVFLVSVAAWTIYKPYISSILFDSPSGADKSASSSTGWVGTLEGGLNNPITRIVDPAL